MTRHSAALLRWSLLTLVLITLHLALMTNEHHDEHDAATHDGVAARLATVAALVPGSLAPHGDHDNPRETLDGCPVGMAILPLLLALLALAGYAFARRAATPPIRATARPLARACEPLPLAAPQRRALLQVFLI
jgi:hypothetical protein